MDKTKRFSVTDAGKNDPIVFDQIFAEKVGGGLVKNSPFDLYPGTAVSEDGNVIKAYKVVEDAADNATSIKIAKNSGIALGDVIAKGKVGVACTAVDTTTSADFDTVTVTLGAAVSKGDVLYQAASASTSSSPAAPIHTPKYLLGEFVEANSGDELVKLVNGANIRKETAPVADEVVALMKSIEKI